MTPAYSELYLQNAQANLAGMLDYATHDLGFAPAAFFDMFIRSGIAEAFGTGDSRYIAGMSGIELAREVLYKLTGEECDTAPSFDTDLSPEYWAGWALAYYQWSTGRSFAEILDAVPIDAIIAMYSPYHEMDVKQFVCGMDEMVSCSGSKHCGRSAK